jgi:tRNA threonylcarbamoyladenosine biosynthesis protein TsaB
MALILSIETSTSVCTVALHQQGHLVSCDTLTLAHSHAESLLAMIRHVVTIARRTTKDLQAVAATGLSYSMDIPLIAINTLETMIAQVVPFHSFPALYCPLIDARRMEVYCMVADSAYRIYQPVGAHIVTANSFAEFLAKNLVFFFGDGAPKVKPVFTASSNARFIDGIYPSAAYMGRLAYEKFQQGNFIDPTTFEPLYIKKPLSTT